MPAKPLTTEQLADARRLKAIFEREKITRPGLSQASIADECGWKTQAAVSQYMNGKIPLGIESVTKFATALRCQIAEISPKLADRINGLAYAASTAENSFALINEDRRAYIASVNRVEPGPDIVGTVPLISWVQAGSWCGVVDNFSPGEAEDWLPCISRVGPHAFALRVRGVSMEPKYQDGDIIFVDPDAAAEHGKNVIVRLDDAQEATFKNLVVEGSRRFLRPLNPDWPEKMIEVNGNATICGVVVGKWVPE